MNVHYSSTQRCADRPSNSANGQTPEHRVRLLIPSGNPQATDPFLLLMEDWFPPSVLTGTHTGEWRLSPM